LFRDVICVIAVYERDDVSLMLTEQEKAHRESREARKCTGQAIVLALNH
jgi:hypothetical protein